MPDSLLPIEIENLVLQRGERPLLDNITCVIKDTGITVIMGPNGAGKSLFLRCLHGLTTADSGRIRLGKEPLGEMARRRQSFVFQQPTLLRRTVLENLLFVIRERGAATEDAWRWLEKLELTTLARQPARLLSGGEAQRLAMARALLTQPEILFLDEATSNLDPTSTQMIETITREAAQNGTKVIMVTHDIGQAKRLADEIVFINHGRICEQRSAGAFFSKPKSEAARAYLTGGIVL